MESLFYNFSRPIIFPCTYLLKYLSSYLSTYLLTHHLTYLPTILPTFLLTYLRYVYLQIRALISTLLSGPAHSLSADEDALLDALGPVFTRNEGVVFDKHAAWAVAR